MADRFVNLLVRTYFTKTNLLVHAIVYPILMSREGGDFHLFLDGISIEAVFVGLMVGISTKQIIKRTHHLHNLLHRHSESIDLGRAEPHAQSRPISE